MKNTTIAVTGAGGYIGSRVVKNLQEEHPDWDVIALDNFYRGNIRQIGDVTVDHVDIRNRIRLEAALSDANIVMHLAAISGVDDCETNRDMAYEVNVQGTSNVAWFCRNYGRGLIFPYSMAVIGDPQTFPITVDHPHDPLNWYGRTKVLGRQTIEAMAQNAFPVHMLMKSNLYGNHVIDGQRVSKGTVTNFFLDRALAGETLTVYKPGVQSRNYVHVKDVARAYVRSAERMLDQFSNNTIQTENYEIATDEDPSVMEVARLVARIAKEQRGIDVDVQLVDNPRPGETTVESFGVDTTKASEDLGWEPTHSIEDTVRERLQNV